MQWVETTGKTVEEAKEAALDQLGVAEDEAEFDVVEEPRPGLFGRLRSEARVRARVKPRAPRPKERRERRRRPRRADSATSENGDSAQATEVDPGGSQGRRGQGPHEGEEMETADEVTIAQQGEVASAFLSGLAEAFDQPAEVAVREIDADTIEVALNGEDLALLVGHRGATLDAVQELARTVVQRQTGARQGRLLVDVGGYRQRRREALERFTQRLADEVKESGARKLLEPMSAADRKVVHDTVNAIDGVRTVSEGEDPRRRVVILPDTEE